jgi:uncharacterized protein DUF6941
MELGFLLLTDAGEALNGKLYALGAGWNMLRFDELPQEWRFGVGIGLDIPWNETNRRHVLEMRFDDPDGDQLGDAFQLDLEVGRPTGAIPGQDQRMVFAVETRQTFEVAGPHAVVISVNGSEIDRSRFYVSLPA